jgi:hypothetical protein
MPAPNDSSLARVRVSTTSGGVYNLVGYVRSADLDRGSEGEATLRWLGGEAVRPGDRTLGGTIPIWWDDADTNGQEILLAAWTNGTTVFLQIAPKGVGSGAKVQQFEAIITAAPLSFDSEGEAVEGSFSFRGMPSTLTTITLI